MQLEAFAPKVNLVLGWSWILLCFLTGMVIGLFFHKENWLGGYTSLKRRMYRLGHISLPALGAVNLLFYLTARLLPPGGTLVPIASWSFVVGAVTMPLCCLIMAHAPKAHLIFSIPVISLLTAGVVTLLAVLQL